MKKITVKDIPAILKKVETRVIELENKRYSYITQHKFIEGHGCIADISELNRLAGVQAYINRHTTDLTTAATQLGIELEDTKLQGHLIGDWKTDVLNRVQEIKDIEELKRLKIVKKKLKKNMSEEDFFNMEMQSISDSLKNIK